jgi:four helix bundle protein
MGERAEELKRRTKQFALDVFRLIKHLPKDEPGPTIRRQLAKSASSVHVNYCASCRARSHDEFISKIAVVAEESDESTRWLTLIVESELLAPTPLLGAVRQEANELVAIFSASLGTARRNRHNG